MVGSSSATELLHPAAARTTAPVPVDALLEMAAGLACIDRSVPPDPDSPPDLPRSIRLLGTASYDVWLVTWPDGSGQSGHDHGDSTGILRVVSGALSERRIPPSRSSAARLLVAGDATITDPGQGHELRNLSGGETTSLHLYSPPLLSVRRSPAEASSAPGY